MRKLLTATLAAAACFACPAHAVDLLQLYRDALANDAQFASARAARAAGQEHAFQGRAGLLPVVGATGSHARTRLEASLSSPPVSVSSRYMANSYTVTLTQPLYRPSNWQQYQQGKLATAISEAQFEQANQDLMLRTAQAYFDLLAAQDTLTTISALKTATSQQLAWAKRNFEVGMTGITDTQEAQARFDLALAQELQAQSDQDVRRGALQQLTGKEVNALAPLRAGVKLAAPEPAQIATWAQNAEQNNFNVIAQQLSLEVAHREIAKSRAGHLPTLDLVAKRSRENGDGVFSPAGIVNNTSVGVQWSIPLFAGMSVSSRVRESIALEDKARSDLETARRTAAQGARQAYIGLSSGLAQVSALESAEVSSQSSLESNLKGYQIGVRINIDVLNAQQQLYSTRRDLAQARYNTILNGLRLKSAAGTLVEDDLAKVNALLKDPT